MSSPTLELNNEIVRAGAGAGKTTRLTQTVLRVAKEYMKIHQRAPKVVVTTFTRKATEELRERLLLAACQEEDAQLIDFVTSHSNLHISTLHGVLSLFLRRFGHWMDIDSGFSVLESAQADRLVRKVLREILVENTEYDVLLDEYNVDHLSKMVLDYDSATSEFGNLKFFTKEDLKTAARQVYEVLAQRLKDLAQRVRDEASDTKWAEYADHLSSCAYLLKSDDAMSGAEWLSRLQTVPKPRYLSKSTPIPQDLHEGLKNFLDESKELDSEEYDPRHWEDYAQRALLFQQLADRFSKRYRELKQSSGQLEMRDLETVSLHAVRTYPDVAKAFSSDWDYWLIDEYQDTSPLQVELLRHLVGSKPVFVVGDPQQSIYLFRGARSEVFVEQENRIESSGGTKSELKKNYRSRPELLMFLNDFFQQFDQKFMVMEPRHAPQNPDATVASFCIVDRTNEEPLLPLAEKILAGAATGARFEEYCVLARTHRELNEIAQYFESLNIPTHIHSSDGFYQRREILDVLSLLKFLLNPLDNLNLMRVLRSPWCRISDQELAESLQKKVHFYWPQLAQLCADHPAIVKLASSLDRVHKIGVYETLKRMVIDWGLIDASHYHDSTGRRESNIWKFLSILKEKERAPGFHYHTFVQQVLQGRRSVEGDEETDAVAALEPDRVNLMTIHKAKGLKFKHVLLPNLHKRHTTTEARRHEQIIVVDENEKKMTLALRLGEERKLKHNLAARNLFLGLSKRESEEHIRLLYVALTRAEESVTLHWQEPFLSSSWASLLSWPLEEGRHPTRHYSYEVCRQFGAVYPYQDKGRGDFCVRPPWSNLENLEKGNQKRFSVTHLLESEAGLLTECSAEKMTPVQNDEIKNRLEAPVFGQRLHSFLERFKYSPENMSVDVYRQKWMSARGSDFEKAVEYVLSLNLPPVRELIRRGEVEWGFQLKTKRGILEGQIDLWGTMPGGPQSGQHQLTTWVVDYKSGSSRSIEKAFDQLNLYALALRARGVEHAIQLAVIYAREQRVAIREAMSQEEILNKFNL